MEERITARIAALENAERDTELQLMAIKTVLAELRALVAPDQPIITEGEDPA